MKTSNRLSIIIAIIILFMTGCGTSSNQTTKKEINVRAGFDGLKMEFLKNTPPQKVFEESAFPVVIKVKNNGAYSVKNEEKAIVSLGVERDYTKQVQLLAEKAQLFEQTSNAASLNLEGKSTINPNGEEQVISYNIVAGRIDPQSEVHQSTAIATLCYPYKTVLDTATCIDTDVSGIKPGKKVCQVQDLIFNNGQGAPVAVTKVEVNMLPSQIEQGIQPKIVPQFLIFVENKGQGNVIKKEAVSSFCTKSDTTHANLNIVYVKLCLSNFCTDNGGMTCQLEKKPGRDELGHIKLKDKKDIIRCFKEEGLDSAQDAYSAPLRIELDYGYTQSIASGYFIHKTAR